MTDFICCDMSVSMIYHINYIFLNKLYSLLKYTLKFLYTLASLKNLK